METISMIEMQNKGNSTTNTLSKRNRTTLPQFFQNANLYRSLHY